MKKVRLLVLFVALLNSVLHAMNKSVAGSDEEKELVEAAKANRVDYVRSMLSVRIFRSSSYQSINYSNTPVPSAPEQAIIEAAENGNLEMVELFLNCVDLHACYYALIRAAENGHLDVVKFLLEKNETLIYQECSYYALSKVLRNNRVDVVVFMLDFMLKCGAQAVNNVKNLAGRQHDQEVIDCINSYCNARTQSNRL